MSKQAEVEKTAVYTVGHSNVEFEKFLSLLRFFSIGKVIDVRSEPVCRYADWFNKNKLEKALDAEGIAYEFLGKKLGGKPDDPSVYDDRGEIDYDKLKETEYFREGVIDLIESAEEKRSAIMCSEENPLHCHRSALITPALEAHGIEVFHIRHDGSLIVENELRPQMKLPLFR